MKIFYHLFIPMEKLVIRNVDNARFANWLTVVIDVFRAFSTQMYMFQNGAKEVFPVLNVEEAFELKRQNPDFLLAVEKWGIMVEWFDFWNSPTEIFDQDLTWKSIIHTTSNWTKWLMNAKDADEVIIWSFLNLDSIVKHIQSSLHDQLTLLSTSKYRREENEDLMLAREIIKTLEWNWTDFDVIKEEAKRTTWYDILFNEVKIPETDFDLSFDINKFDFLIKKFIENDRVVLKKI